jgi:hypothetical protein
VLAEADAGEAGPAADIAPGGAVHAVAAGVGNNKEMGARHGEFAVVGRDRAGCGLDALEDNVVREIELALREVDLQRGAPDAEAAGGTRRTVTPGRIP